MKPSLDKFSDNVQALLDIYGRKNTEFSGCRGQIDQTWGMLSQFADQQKDAPRLRARPPTPSPLALSWPAIVIAILAGFGLILIFRRPIGQITAAMRRLAEGVLDTAIQGDKRSDEIVGDMARALSIFKANALEKLRVENLSEEQRLAAEAERLRNDAEKAGQSGTDRLCRSSAGSIPAPALRWRSETCAISTPFSGGLDQLRQDFNGSLERLNETLAQIRQDAHSIQAQWQCHARICRRTVAPHGIAGRLARTDRRCRGPITVTVRQTAGRQGRPTQSSAIHARMPRFRPRSLPMRSIP